MRKLSLSYVLILPLIFIISSQTTHHFPSSLEHSSSHNTLSVFGEKEKSLIKFCGEPFSNKNNGQLFQDVRRLTLNCDSTFTWKHQSCISRDSSFGNWKVINNLIYLTSSKKIKKIIAKQPLKTFGKYVDLSNTTLVFKDSFIVWKRSTVWIDTLYRK